MIYLINTFAEHLRCLVRRLIVNTITLPKLGQKL